MRIVCPSCEATYNVPDAMLAAGSRKVRCARCGNEWAPAAASAPAPPTAEADESFAPPPTAASAAPQPPAAPPSADAEPPGRPEPRAKPLRPRAEPRLIPPPPTLDEEPPERSRTGAVVAWALTVLILAAAGAAAVLWRAQVMAAWPPSERVYAALGLS
jgi:predicted Zn finger-like uncharacterized protein